jgi:hypothetical protein
MRQLRTFGPVGALGGQPTRATRSLCSPMDYLDSNYYTGWPCVARAAILALFFVALTNLLTRRRIRLRV